jgi:hypothetical protein
MRFCAYARSWRRVQKNAGKRFLGNFTGETKKIAGIRPVWEWWGFGQVSTGWRSSYRLIF